MPFSIHPKGKTLADQLRHAIEDSDMKPAQIAREAGISQIVLDRFRNGERDLRLRTAGKVAAVLSLRLTYRSK